YIVMDYVEGPTLDNWLKRLTEEHKIVALEESLRIVRRVAMAVHYAHERGVLHRDIKPANIILRPIDPALEEADDLPFQPVLTDFGLAHLAEGSVHTQTGMAMGTPTYMSPEQCLGTGVDRRTDVYALGILLYELSTGCVPFAVKTLTEAMRAHTQEPPPPPRSVNPNLPVEVEDVILRALAKRKEDRYPTARALADAIRSAVASMPAGLVVTPVLPSGGGGDAAPVAGPAPEVDTDVSAAPFHGDLTVTLADGSERRVVMEGKRTLTVGRTGENDVVLADSKVSRKHARIDVDGPDLLVVDLHSTNGTYLGDSRLLPGVAVKWPAGVALHIGDCLVRIAPAVPSATPLGPPGGTVIDARSRASAASQIHVSATGFDLQVEAGGRASTTFTALNAGMRVDHFETTVEGVPPAWVAQVPPVVRLLPNDRQELTVAFAPPRSPQSWADVYPVTIRVAGQTDRSQAVSVSGALRVLPYYEWTLGLYPQRQTGSGEGTFEVRLENQGNAPLEVQLSATDPEVNCTYAFSPARVTVAPASWETVPLVVRAHRPPAENTTPTYAFTVVARAPHAPEPVKQAQGQWVQVAPRPQPTPRAAAAPQLEATLLPERHASVGTATFHVEVTNQGNADCEVTVEASDPTGECAFAVGPAQVILPAGGKRSVTVEVTSRKMDRDREPASHPFVVTVRAVGVPGVVRELQGEWVQLVKTRSVWPPLLLIVLGWALGWGVWAATESWQFATGAIMGVIGGLFTGWALRLGRHSGRPVLAMVFGWGMMWGIGMGGIAMGFDQGVIQSLTGLTFLFGGVCALIGLGGGVITAGVLPLGASRTAVSLGWTLTWGAAGLILMAMVYGGAPWVVGALFIGAIGGAIGGGITLYQVRHAKQTEIVWAVLVEGKE
ncbi:MAG: protein kinase, partial [Anaerolineae bacterium]|nr:protein kinase [Anaerolineae bacterium]